MPTGDPSLALRLFLAWLVRCEQGRGESLAELVARHPEVADELYQLNSLRTTQTLQQGRDSPPGEREFVAWLRARGGR